MKQVLIKDGFHWLDQSLVPSNHVMITLSCRTIVVKSLQRSIYPCELWLVNSSSIVKCWSSMVPFHESKTNNCGTTSCAEVREFLSEKLTSSKLDTSKGWKGWPACSPHYFIRGCQNILHSPQWGDLQYWPHKAKGPSCIWINQPRFPPWSMCYDLIESAEVGRR